MLMQIGRLLMEEWNELHISKVTPAGRRTAEKNKTKKEFMSKTCPSLFCNCLHLINSILYFSIFDVMSVQPSKMFSSKRVLCFFFLQLSISSLFLKSHEFPVINRWNLVSFYLVELDSIYPSNIIISFCYPSQYGNLTPVKKQKKKNH